MGESSKKHVQVVEVGPRDGFQSIQAYIPAETKLEVIRGIYSAGVKKIQITSFVSPKAVPQMRDAAEIVEKSLQRFPDATLFALVPNFKGAELAVKAGLREVSTVVSLSESHNKANVGRTVEESLAGVDKILQSFPELKVGLDIATAFGCPFEGDMPTSKLIALLGRLYDMGIRSFTLCDTVGVAYPQKIRTVMREARAAFADAAFGIHIHDTRNMGILNSYVGLQAGADSVQAALGGLGGCPFAPGASGNTATEDLVYMLEKEGFDTGIDFEKLLSAAKYLHTNVAGNYSGHHISIGHCCEK